MENNRVGLMRLQCLRKLIEVSRVKSGTAFIGIDILAQLNFGLKKFSQRRFDANTTGRRAIMVPGILTPKYWRHLNSFFFFGGDWGF